MRKIAQIVALMAIALPAPALAADWVWVSDSANGDKYFVDRQSVRTMPNGYKRAWIRSSYSKPDPDGTTGSRYFKELDCTEGRDRNLQSTFFKGEKNWGTDYNPTKWAYIEPETNGEAMFKFICRK